MAFSPSYEQDEAAKRIVNRSSRVSAHSLTNVHDFSVEKSKETRHKLVFGVACIGEYIGESRRQSRQ